MQSLPTLVTTYRGHTPGEVYQSVLAFFEERCGETTDGISIMPHREAGLLRTACVGNPERTMQGELFAYLKREHLNVVLEYRLHSFTLSMDRTWEDGRSIDIMVLDEDYRPACAIELKHLGRVQGHVGSLLNGLEEDWNRFEEVKVPLIQVGLYTDISHLPNDTVCTDFEAFRFISCYVYHKDGRLKKLKPGCDARGDAGHDWLQDWAHVHCEKSKLSFCGSREQFKTPVGPVVGRVHYFVGLMKDNGRSEATAEQPQY